MVLRVLKYLFANTFGLIVAIPVAVVFGLSMQVITVQLAIDFWRYVHK